MDSYYVSVIIRKPTSNSGGKPRYVGLFLTLKGYALKGKTENICFKCFLLVFFVKKNIMN